MNYEKAQRISKEMGEWSDCTVKAIAIACDKPYRMVHAMLKEEGRKDRRGCFQPEQFRTINRLGYKLTRVEGEAPFRFGGTVTTLPKRLPSKGNYIAYVRGHIIAVKDGKIEDWTEGRRHRILEVYKVERKERKPRHKSMKAA